MKENEKIEKLLLICAEVSRFLVMQKGLIAYDLAKDLTKAVSEIKRQIS